MEMIYPISGSIVKRSGRPKARDLPGFANIPEEVEESSENQCQEQNQNASNKEEDWLLDPNPNSKVIAETMSKEGDKDEGGESDHGVQKMKGEADDEGEEKRGFKGPRWVLNSNNNQQIDQSSPGFSGKRSSRPNTKKMTGLLAQFEEEARREGLGQTTEENGKTEEVNELQQHQWHNAHKSGGKKKAATETRWVLGNSGIITVESAIDDELERGGEESRQAVARNIRATVTRRKGTRIRKPVKFLGEEEATTSTTKGSMEIVGEATKKVGENKRYASINVRTLAMQGDMNRKKACG